MALGFPSGLPDIFAGIPGLPGYQNQQAPKMPQDDGLGFALADFLPPEANQQIPDVAPQSRGDAILALLGHASQNANLQPRGFGQGLISGILGGLGGEGLRRESERAKLEAAQKQRQQTKDMANLEASRAYRNARVTAITSQGKQHMVTAQDVAATPSLARLQGQRVSQSFYEQQAGAESPQDKLKRIEAEHAAMARGTARGGAGNADISVGGLTDAAKHLAAVQYLQTGQMPAFGMGKQAAADRRDVLNMAAQINPQGAIAANKAALAANTQSLVQLQKNLDSVNAFEETAKRNTAVMLSTLNKIPETGTRPGNWLLRHGASLMGSDAMSAFNGALETVRPEWARILQGGTLGSAALTDSQKKDLAAVIAGDYTRDQIKSAVGILQKDADNRRQSYEGQIREVQRRIAEGPTISIGGAASPNLGTTQSRSDSRPPLSSFMR